MKYIIMMLFAMNVLATETNTTVDGTDNNSNVNIFKPTLIVKPACDTCCKKPKVITKVVEKKVIVEKQVETVKHVKNRISLLGGVGPKGNLKETPMPGYIEYSTENGPVFAIQYSRDLSDNQVTPVLSIQAQTNRTLMLGLGVGF